MSDFTDSNEMTTIDTNPTEIFQDNPNLTAMDLIANNNNCIKSIGTSVDAVNQFKLFLVAQAKNELNRVVKLTRYLDVIEDKFISLSDDLMAEYPDNLSLVTETMKALTACINRSNELITQIVSDEKLNSFVVAKPIDADENKLDIESRNKIREMANSLLKQIDAQSK